jgi:hypothetical protein
MNDSQDCTGNGYHDVYALHGEVSIARLNYDARNMTAPVR